MVAIASVGGYVPLYRIERAEIASQHGGTASGETAVPARDETTLTMASEAAGTALARTDLGGEDLDAVFAASVTDPYAEHGIAAHVAYRHGAAGDLRTGDFRGSPRAATDAFAAASHFVEATGGNALAVGTDAMPVDPGHDDEPYAGAAAGAVILTSGEGRAPDEGGSAGEGSTDDNAATIHGIGQNTTGFVERHRKHGAAAESGDRRFEGEAGFGGAVPQAVQRALETAPGMPEAVVLTAPDQRMVRGAIGEFPGEVEHVSTFESIGYAGTASFYLDLAHLLESADAGTPAIAVAYGAGGADAVALTGGIVALTGGTVDPAGALTVEEQLAAKSYVTYAEHLRYRERPDYEGVMAK